MEYIELITKVDGNTFTIHGCGKFSDESLHLDRAKAALLYIKLTEFLGL